MKRFRWRLQRVLDVTARRELAVKAEVSALSRSILEARTERIGREARVRMNLTQLAEGPAERRLADQELFMRTVEHEQRALRSLEDRIAAFQKRREEKHETLMELRKRRKMLERLRDEARRRYRREQELLEQKEIDDRTSTAFARGMLAAAGRLEEWAT